MFRRKSYSSRRYGRRSGYRSRGRFGRSFRRRSRGGRSYGRPVIRGYRS